MKNINHFLQNFFNWTNFYYGYQLVVSSSFLLFYAFFLYSFFILNDLSSIETLFFNNFLSIILFTTLIVFVEIIDFLLKNFEIKNKRLKHLLENIFKTDNKPDVSFFGLHYDVNGRYLKIILNNNNLLNNQKVLKPIYNYLMNDETFLNFGYNKIIIITGVTGELEYQLHPNVFINNETPFDAYYDKVIDIINNHYKEGSSAGIKTFEGFEILVWNVDNKMNKHIKITEDARSIHEKKIFHSKTNTIITKRFYHKINNIKPIKKLNNIKPKNFASLDVETMNINGYQQPVAISLTSSKETKIFLIDHVQLKTNIMISVNDLWLQLFNYLETPSNINFETIFIHNLGKFDGIFLFKALSNFYLPSQINTIIDDSNKFILISVKLKKYKLTFKDSQRIFPVSLEELCKVFKTEGKLSEYKKSFNKIELFNNKSLLKDFIKYSCQDSKALFNALVKAQKEFITSHNVDITAIVSTSSLALKIFRTNYLKTEIPILSSNDDSFIRKSYYGGATDYYQCYAKHLHYYDVNSLYPHAMCNPMPYKILRKYENMDSVNLNNFFGFCLAEIHCPENILKPMLPVRYKGKTIFPNGVWTGAYFSEELKAVIPQGYKIKLIKGIEFSKIDLFSEYVKKFYKIKMNTDGSEKWICKLLLNCLYGVFGRKQELLETVNVYNSDIEKYVLTNVIKSIIPINEKISTLLMIKNINHNLIKEMNNTHSVELKTYKTVVKSNVGIASAITSYARIHMIKFKLNPNVVYTDTDSIFTTSKIDDNLIGNEIGLMKDVMKGLIIEEAYFLGIKQYGYWYRDSKNIRIVKSVFAGVKRNTLTFHEIKKIYNGDIITKKIPLRFFKSLINLKIKTKPTKITICKQFEKNLINNKYKPLTINNNLWINSINKLKTYLIKIKKLFNKS